MMEKDYGLSFFEIRAMLLDLLAKNRQNRMAFEYLMSLYLLEGDLEAFVRSLNRLDDFNYPRIPRLYEEAILFYTASTEKQVDLHGRRISHQSRQRFTDFVRIFKLHRENKEAAFDELARNHGDSYFFYSLYGFSEVKK